MQVFSMLNIQTDSLDRIVFCSSSKDASHGFTSKGNNGLTKFFKHDWHLVFFYFPNPSDTTHTHTHTHTNKKTHKNNPRQQIKSTKQPKTETTHTRTHREIDDHNLNILNPQEHTKKKGKFTKYTHTHAHTHLLRHDTISMMAVHLEHETTVESNPMWWDGIFLFFLFFLLSGAGRGGGGKMEVWRVTRNYNLLIVHLLLL